MGPFPVPACKLSASQEAGRKRRGERGVGKEREVLCYRSGMSLKGHVLKAWSPACGTTGGGAAFKGWSTVRGREVIGAISLKGILGLWPLLSLSSSWLP